MEEKYKIFEKEAFNKILELVERVDVNAANQYKKVIDCLPKKIVKALGECEDFSVFAKEYDADLIRIEDGVKDSIFLTYNNFKTNLKIQLNIFPFSEFDVNPGDYEVEDDLNDEEDISQYEEDIEDKPWFVFSLTFTVNNNRGFDWEVYVQPYNDEFQIISIKNHSGEMVNQKIITLSYDELIEYADDEEYEEEDYDETLEDVEFSGVAEYDEETGEVKVTAIFENADFENIKIDEESGKPEVEVELHVELPPEEDSFDDETDYYTP